MTTLSPEIIERINSAHVTAEWTTGADEMTAKSIADVLEKKYPGYLWAVNVNSAGGVITLLCMNLSGKYGHVIKMGKLDTWDSLRDKVMRGAGEILERYSQPRSRFHADRYNNLALDLGGLPVGDNG